MLIKDRCIEVDVLARRYGVLPSELVKIDAADFSLNMLVASRAIEAENKASEKARRQGRRR